MKKVIISVFVLFVCVAIPAQINKDSLWSVWNDTTRNENNRLDAINDLCVHYRFSQTDSAYYLATLMYKYAELKNNKIGIIKALKNQAIVSSIQSQYNVAIFHINQAFQIAEILNDASILSDLNNIAGIFQLKLNNYKKAHSYYSIALELGKKAGSSNVNGILGNIATVYKAEGKFNEALNTYFKSIRSLKSIPTNEFGTYEEKLIAVAHLNISNLYKDLGYYNKAISYLEMAENVFKENHEHYFAKVKGTYGEISYLTGEYKKSINYFNEAIEIGKKIHSNTNSYKLDVAKVLLKTNNKIDAIELLNSLKNSDLTDIEFEFNLILSSIEDDRNKAILYAEKALSIADHFGARVQIKEAAEVLYGLYKRSNNKLKALQMHELYILMRDSIQNYKALYQFEYEKKALADSIVNIKQKKIKQLEHESQLKEERTIRYGILVLLTLILCFSFLLFQRFRVTKKQNKIIKSQKKQVDEAFKELDIQSQKIEQKNKEVLASINYASKIQDTILPNVDQIKSHFKNLFVLYHPKDIVGGDFYWYRSFGGISVIATVDCTGHGVPGGFMSMMGSLLLDKIVNENRLNTGDILKELNNEIVRVLDQKSGGVIQDGMDIALCVFNTENRTLSYSGARNGIMILKNNQLRCFDAEIFSVGGSYSKKSQLLKRDFKTHSIELNKNEWIFMYTDGYYDQLGGKDINSMGMKLFQDNLMGCLSAEESKDVFLKREFDKWKGDLPQIDDVLVLGFQV